MIIKNTVYTISGDDLGQIIHISSLKSAEYVKELIDSKINSGKIGKLELEVNVNLNYLETKD